MERLFVFADFNWLGKGELVGELCYEKLRGSGSYAFKFDENGLRFMPELSFRKTSTITQACNIPSQEVIFSDVFLMLCQIGGDVPCSKEEISKKNKHVRQLDAIKDAEIIGKYSNASWVLNW